MPGAVRIAVVGVGKIARDQHLPAIAANPGFVLTATASRAGDPVPGVPMFPDIAAMLKDGPPLDAVAVCTPPGPRPEIARAALAAGLDVLLEKPPAASVSAFLALRDAAAAAGRVLFQTWHARHAAMVARATELARGRTVTGGRITWRESARKWHPGQTWLWEPGGLGVFDPGINGLSVLTAVAPAPVTVRSAAFEVPAGAATPIAARLELAVGDAPVMGDFDFRQETGERWEIALDFADGPPLLLTEGGAKLAVGGEPQPAPPNAEYPELYARFAELVAARRSDTDDTPLRLVADAFLLARSTPTDAYIP